MRFASLHFFDQLWQDAQNISYHTKISRSKNRRIFVLVDRYNKLGTLHASQMLNRATDATGNVKRWLNRLAGLADLVAIGQQPASTIARVAPGAPPRTLASS